MPQPLTSNCRVKNDWAMRNMATKAANVVKRVQGEHAHGERSRWRHFLLWSATIVCGGLSFTKAPMVESAFGCAMGDRAVVRESDIARGSAAIRCEGTSVWFLGLFSFTPPCAFTSNPSV